MLKRPWYVPDILCVLPVRDFPAAEPKHTALVPNRMPTQREQRGRGAKAAAAPYLFSNKCAQESRDARRSSHACVRRRCVGALHTMPVEIGILRLLFT